MGSSTASNSLQAHRLRGVTAARATARRAADDAGVDIRPLMDLDDARDAAALFTDVWKPADGIPPITVDLVRALQEARAYVVGAYDDTILVGACLGFWGPPASRSLHSHIAGVAPSYRSRHVGYALKLHQRARALEQGVDQISWTFDPLVARNAHFNLRRLGARPTDYLINLYGPMVDDLNGVDDSDRVLVRWCLSDRITRRACDTGSSPPPAPAGRGTAALTVDLNGRPVVLRAAGSDVVTVAIPRDIEALRRTDPAAAAAWRIAAREAFTDLLSAGARVVDFDRDHSHYVWERGQ